ncbi:MAG TPA: peptidoglycan DD-metalloendopeptidase family protein, partial [Ktedonobacteraceae bacterium]|nr:peptidoglycan DD-metalloendopeptidase family protein [Ktedonobacteraceae bacterium]
MKIISYIRRLPLWLAGTLAARWLLALFLVSSILGGLFAPVQAALPSHSGMSVSSKPRSQAPEPFMHKPYYGSEDFHTRINSYFDHDKPWYADDSIFVRYDGKRWEGSDTSVVNCQAGTTCYDGHNGYDLRMRFEPVLSSAAGKVINAGWYNAQNHSDSFGLWAAIDHGNGFVNVYGHLSALTVSVGQHVGTQWQIGTSGTTGSSTGPHLHFGTYYYPSWQPTDPFGWTSKRDDPNTVPDYNLWSTGDNITPVPRLGGHGKNLAPGAVLVDDGSPGWSATGRWSVSSAKSDIGGSLHWTATTGGSATATATWQTLLPEDGYYEIGAFVDDNHASSGWASYTIASNDPDHPDTTVTHRVEVDQEHVGSFQNAFGNVNTGAQWIGLGTYYFKAGHQGKVTLNNATGENDQQLAADGIEFAPLVPPKYAFTLDEDTTPAQMLAGDRATVKLKLTNTSSFPWPAEGLQAVQIIYRWLDSQGHAVLVSSPVSLAQDLPIKGSVTSTIEVQAPVQAGTYTLQWDLLRGTEAFSQQGAHLENHSIIVSDPTSESDIPPVDASPVAPGVPPVASPGSGPIVPPGVPPVASPGSGPIVPPGVPPVASPGSRPIAPPAAS